MASQGVTTTEIAVAGANCPWCFSDTVDLLRSEPGVVSVRGSIAGECIRVDHERVDVDRLIAVVRRNLHADDVSPTSAEHVMVEVDARIAELRCTHGWT